MTEDLIGSVEEVCFTVGQAGASQHFLQISSGAEGRAVTGENHHSQLVIAGNVVEATFQLVQRRQVQGVHGPWSIERQARHWADDFILQNIFTHDYSPLLLIALMA
ncbi:hypothetical protein D3C85_1586920 [compost metagenome]